MNIKSIAAVGALSLASFSAVAATATSTLDVNATVVDSCAVTTTAVSFGDYNPVTAAEVTAQGAINVTCSNGTTYEIGLDGGGSADVANRAMDHAVAGTLTYDLFRDSARTSNWGNTTASDVLAGLTGTGAEQVHPVYGRIDAGQATAAKGSYTDTVNVTVTYGL